MAFSFNGQPPKWYAHPALWATDLNRGRAGLYTNGTAAEFADFKLGERSSSPIYTPSSPRLDYRGDVLSRRVVSHIQFGSGDDGGDRLRHRNNMPLILQGF